MKGLEIIECIPVKQVPDLVMICFIVGTVSILIPSYIVLKLTKNFNKALVTELISGLIYMVFVLVLLTSGVFEKPTGEYHYKVKLTEDVGYVEFTNKYDVVTENDDGTYIIQEKPHKYVAMAALLTEKSEELELFCQLPVDRQKFYKYFSEYPEVT